MPPTLANGKICYLEIPASDVSASAEAVVENGGTIVQPIGADPQITARSEGSRG